MKAQKEYRTNCRRENRSISRRILAALAMLAVVSVASAAAADPVKLRIAWIVPAGDAPFALLGKQGVAVHDGKSYTLQFVHFAGSSPMISALAAGEVDIAPLGFGSFPLAVENAKLDELRIIADDLQDGVPGYLSTEFMVLNDGPIKKIEDLKGKVAAANAVGASPDLAIRSMMKQHGLVDKKDYTLVETALPNMKSQLIEHKIDLTSSVPPFDKDPALLAVAHPLFTQADAWGKSQLLSYSARASFLAQNRSAVVDFLEDNLRLLHWYSDPANENEMIETVTAFTKTPPGLWKGWVFGKGDLYRDPRGQPDLDALTRNIATVHELGFLSAALDPRKYADLSLVEEAASRLK